jgi:hypothetical protein
MGTLLLFGAICLTWGIMGLLLTVAPTVWVGFMKNVLDDPWQRFWMTQGMLLVGLVLIIGTPDLQWYVLWLVMGGAMVIKACIILGSSEALRKRFLAMSMALPIWVYRCSGILTLVIVVLLASDIILHG